MPTWQPNWTDVQFDTAANDEAIAACHRALVTLADRHLILEPVRSTARTEWRGRARESFDEECARLEASAIDACSVVRRVIDALYEDAREARDEQSRRVAQRERWHDERRAEDQRAARAQQPANESHDRKTPPPTPTAPLPTDTRSTPTVEPPKLILVDVPIPTN